MSNRDLTKEEKQIKNLYDILVGIRDIVFNLKNNLNQIVGEKSDAFELVLGRLITGDTTFETFLEASKEYDFFNGYIRNLKLLHTYFVDSIPNITKLYAYRIRESALEGSLEYGSIILNELKKRI